jgi:hypothetical protein
VAQTASSTVGAPPSPRHDYTGTCWWCGAPADSREHRHKASDLRREFARGEYEKGDVIVRREREAIQVRGPNSMQAKFGNMFCASCNNARSQPFDRAYDRFIEWYLAQEREVEKTGVLRLDEMHDDLRTGTRDVLRYFVKHIGCRIADSGYTVPSSFRDFLENRGEPTGLICSFEMNAVHAEVHAILREHPTEDGSSGILMLGPVTREMTGSEEDATVLRGWWSYHGLQLVWSGGQSGPTVAPISPRSGWCSQSSTVRKRETCAAFGRAARSVCSGGRGTWRGRPWAGPNTPPSRDRPQGAKDLRINKRGCPDRRGTSAAVR